MMFHLVAANARIATRAASSDRLNSAAAICHHEPLI
jgi:hypothetical protein